ncbi:biphenyl 2,3-dioxygenase [Erwinia sp. OLTSP20]|uniref:GNAT family N-acetyltransferase n=1 Tax=unclassified Erwinia TaxID=2622719 RepID=UPI000C17AD38|nr:MULTISPECIES: GNAT family N-acetyltransferase [unclassified Erwinia]PIJ49224.1 biphenyl 2,3-dioxygenase [Erwinia sp. OAMSP11]PIJ70506.1 biphenyl 2,3-dioxygenase [Erwinia sp. OLSSP12]PIJ78744.1 biphenyl 2,3-dioxygenase [Erwinia sp. OLCASP19]PIJ81233.1 biphenyl 2,3-dioxygenase [Erwinia sp. OLMTSP26]PIJ84482.1 biphenyl 2,3-dioxygenase [Erwinia sp. OLMDSP33]
MDIVLTHNPRREDVDDIRRGLVDYNRQFMDIQRTSPLGLFINDPQGKKLAGLTGSLSGDWLRIEMLWISEALRGQQVGTRLMQAAEEEARQHQCRYAQVDTASFQARPFYEKLGYRVGWVLDNYPHPGAQRFYLTKHL